MRAADTGTDAAQHQWSTSSSDDGAGGSPADDDLASARAPTTAFVRSVFSPSFVAPMAAWLVPEPSPRAPISWAALENEDGPFASTRGSSMFERMFMDTRPVVNAKDRRILLLRANAKIQRSIVSQHRKRIDALALKHAEALPRLPQPPQPEAPEVADAAPAAFRHARPKPQRDARRLDLVGHSFNAEKRRALQHRARVPDNRRPCAYAKPFARARQLANAPQSREATRADDAATSQADVSRGSEIS